MDNINIVAIGGGKRDEALQHAVDLSGEQNPSVLIVPTACSTEASYSKNVPVVMERFRKLGVATRVLHEYGGYPSRDQLINLLGVASLVYIIGGNTPYMLKQIDAHGSRNTLQEYICGGKVHADTSAGALLPFELAHSCVAHKPAEVEWDYKLLPTLGAVPGVITAHANQHDPTPHGQRPDSRLDALISNFPESQTIGYAVDNSASLVIANKEISAIHEEPKAEVRIIRPSAQGHHDITLL